MIKVDKENRGFSPTVQWMNQKYNEMNVELFNGELGNCDFEVFTTGNGSQGKRLGFFSMRGYGLKYNTQDRRLFIYSSFERVFINKNNFSELAKPLIAINGNYTGTEYGFLATLVHEMCHYYTYMYGRVPTQAHGREFRDIGSIVSYKSGGLFTIQRLASAEDMSHLDLSDEMKAKKEKRIENKKSKIYAVFEYKGNEIHLTTTSNQRLIDEICNFKNRNNVKQVIVSNDNDLIEFLFSKGYNRNLRTWRYWQVGDKEWINMLNDVDKQVITNPNYMNESKTIKTIDDIINEAFEKMYNEKYNDEFMEITPDMDLGAYSPLELQ